MNAAPQPRAKFTDNEYWMYVCLAISMLLLGGAANVVYATMTKVGWQASQGFPFLYFILAAASLVFVRLAKLAKSVTPPPASVGGILGLVAIVGAALSFDFGILVINPGFWIALSSGVVTFFSLFVGWRSDAAGIRMDGEIKDLQAEIYVKNEVIDALNENTPRGKKAAVLLTAATAVGFLGFIGGRFQQHDGGQR